MSIGLLLFAVILSIETYEEMLNTSQIDTAIAEAEAEF